MIEIQFEGHALTADNLAGVASGHHDVALADVGIEHASTKRRQRYADKTYDLIYTSDMQRAYDESEVVEEDLSLANAEKELIIKALRKHNGRRKEAAAELGISERTLYRKIKEYDVSE